MTDHPTGDGRSTWVVLCPGAEGPRSEYVDGTEVVADPSAGVLRVLDGGQVVREYAAGAWSTFCEWVGGSTDYFANTSRRWGAPPAPRPPSDAERLLDGAMRMDTSAALSMLHRSRGGH